MSTQYDCYTGFIPAHFCDARVLQLLEGLKRLNKEAVRLDEHGAEFPVEEDYTGGPYISGLWKERPFAEWANGLMDELMRERKISLTYLGHFDSGDCGYDEEKLPAPEDWEAFLSHCPTLVLREIIAKRQESLEPSP